MKRLLFALLLVGTATVQVTLLPRANPLEVGPDLVLGLVLVSSSLGGVAVGMIWAALAGFTLDLLTLEPLGSHGLALLLVAIIGGLARRRLFRSDLVVPMGLVVLVLKTISAFGIFDIVYVLTGGGPANSTQVLGYYIYMESFKYLHVGYGAALSYVVAAIILVLVFIYVRLLRFESIREGA